MSAGYEYASLLGALELVARGDSGLAPASRQKLKGVSRPLALQGFVTPTCPYCPRAVMLAFQLAMESPSISAAKVEATEFPHLANRHHVSGVPHTAISDSGQPRAGALPEAAAIDLVVAAAVVPVSAPG
ncbi:MAG TPA: thioredoxin family protein [Desulfobacterales bacterium]|nr:thioredoxin family protein [Desulfobacterales bacterium]